MKFAKNCAGIETARAQFYKKNLLLKYDNKINKACIFTVLEIFFLPVILIYGNDKRFSNTHCCSFYRIYFQLKMLELWLFLLLL